MDIIPAPHAKFNKWQGVGLKPRMGGREWWKVFSSVSNAATATVTLTNWPFIKAACTKNQTEEKKYLFVSQSVPRLLAHGLCGRRSEISNPDKRDERLVVKRYTIFAETPKLKQHLLKTRNFGQISCFSQNCIYFGQSVGFLKDAE